jgi:type 1 glutamine amidotransferase
MGLEVIRVRADEPWDEGPELIGRADGVVLFLCEGGRWMARDPKRLSALTALVKRGGGVVGLHWGVGTKDAANIDACLNVLGGCHGGPDRKYQVLEADLTPADGKLPILNGIGSLRVKDEFYYQLKFTVEGALKPVLRAAIDGKQETVAWAWERPDGGRSFGFSGLHFHENWKTLAYRRLVSQGVLWTLKLPIPENGLAADVPEAELKLK